MKKYLVIDDTTNSASMVETWVFDTLEEANRHALYRWDHTTERGKREAEKYYEKYGDAMYVAVVTEADLSEDAFDEDGSIDWRMCEQWNIPEGAFHNIEYERAQRAEREAEAERNNLWHEVEVD